jgi:hypothetical protein
MIRLCDDLRRPISSVKCCEYGFVGPKPYSKD